MRFKFGDHVSCDIFNKIHGVVVRTSNTFNKYLILFNDEQKDPILRWVSSQGLKPRNIGLISDPKNFGAIVRHGSRAAISTGIVNTDGVLVILGTEPAVYKSIPSEKIELFQKKEE